VPECNSLQAQTSSIDGPDHTMLTVVAPHGPFGDEQRVFECSNRYLDFRLFAEMKVRRAIATCDIYTTFLADPVALDTDAHDASGKFPSRERAQLYARELA
jgi:hypothetical protein